MQQTYRMTMMLKDGKTTILTLKAISAEAAILKAKRSKVLHTTALNPLRSATAVQV